MNPIQALHFPEEYIIPKDPMTFKFKDIFSKKLFTHAHTKTKDFWTNIQVRWHKLDKNLVTNLKTMSGFTQAELVSTAEIGKKILVQALQNYDDKKCTVLKDLITQVFRRITPEMLDETISQYTKNSVEEGKTGLIGALSELLTATQMEALVNQRNGGRESVEKLIEKMHKCAPKFGSFASQSAFSTEFKNTLSKVLMFIPNLINTFLAAFRLFDLGKEPENAWEASGLLDVYYKLFMIPSNIVILLLAVIQVSWQAWAIALGIIVLGIVLVYSYITWLKPCPEKIANCENYTLDAKMDKIPAVIGRDTQINFLANYYANNKAKNTRHIMLVGPTGVGKTEIVRGLAQKIASGNVPKGMKNKKIFMINTGRLAQKGMIGYADQLEIIFQRIKNYEGEVILFFDEIQAAFETPGLVNYLKPHLSRGNIQCIAAMTLQDYNKYIVGTKDRPGDEAFARRFQKYTVESLSKPQTMKILFETLEDQPDILFDKEAVERAYELTESKDIVGCQPSKSVNLLLSTADEIRNLRNHTPLHQELKDKEAKLEKLQSIFVNTAHDFHPGVGDGNKLSDKIEKVTCEVNELKGRLKIENDKLKKIQDYIKERRGLQSNIYKAVELLKKNPKNEKEIKSFVLSLEYMIPTITRAIEECEKSLSKDVSIRVTKEMIEKAFNDVNK